MLISVVSECKRGAWRRTRRVLDAFLERTGERNWHGRITEEGLSALREELASEASRNTSVAAYRVRGKKRFELEWIVGSTVMFGPDGQRATYTGHSYDRYFSRKRNRPDSFDWLSLILETAGLWHDAGKANEEFQSKLNEGAARADTVRHEILSCLAFQRVIGRLIEHGKTEYSASEIQTAIDASISEPFAFQKHDERVDIAPISLPFAWRLVSWLIATHHRLPDSDGSMEPVADRALFKLTNHTNKEKLQGGRSIYMDKRFSTHRLAENTARLVNAISAMETPDEFTDWRAVTAYGRLALILADREVSKRDFDPIWHEGGALDANTLLANYSRGSNNAMRRPKQSLEEHLLKVSSSAAVALSDIIDMREESAGLPAVGLPKSLREKSGGRFSWQSESVSKVKGANIAPGDGFFGQVIAGTGSGKTRACPKILAAAGDTLRYTLCLPLRSLTLQSGEEYNRDLGLSVFESTTIIGSRTVKELFEDRSSVEGSESAVSFQDDIWTSLSETKKTKNLLRTHLPSSSHKHLAGEPSAGAFLAVPIVVSTIDQIMPAADARRTSYIMAALRLATSDLVLDEIDSYDAEDQVAIGRLVYMAGLFGRKVLLASATLTAGHGKGLFEAYTAGFLAHARFYGTKSRIHAGFFSHVDGSSNVIECQDGQAFEAADMDFRNKVIEAARVAPTYRKGIIADDTPKGDMDAYFARALESARAIHDKHSTKDPRTGKNVSSVLVRFAHIRSCVKFAQWLQSRRPDLDVDLKILLYHSGFPLLVRDEIESFLDEAFRRKPTDRFLSNNHIRNWLAQSSNQENMFLLVATSVEEIGRDHDFDGAVIEPTSLHSIIQCSGRVQRHRLKEAEHPNVFILPTSVRGIDGGTGYSYVKPGPEGKSDVRGEPYRLARMMKDNLSRETTTNITAIPRIDPEHPDRMARVEQEKLSDYMSIYNPRSLASYCNEDNQFWLSSWHATEMRFRRSGSSMEVWFDPGYPRNIACDAEFFCVYDDSPMRETIRIKSTKKNDLFLFSLSATDILLRRFGERVEEKKDWERACRKFLRASLTLYDGGTEMVYAENFGIYPSE